MIRTQIQLTEEQARALREMAADEQVSVAELIRRAVDTWLDGRREMPPAERRLRARDAPGFRTGITNLAAEHDAHLVEGEA